MTRCRSSAGCRREAGFGTFGTLCRPCAEELAAIKARWFSPQGSVLQTAADATVPTRIEDTARTLAIDVLREGRITIGAARRSIGDGADRSIGYATRSNWIESDGKTLVPGAVLPPGRLPRDARAAMLARYLREVGGIVAREDAADAIGLKPSGLGRVLAFARERGLVRAVPGRGGGLAAV